MNKICRRFFCFLAGIFVISCSSLPKEEVPVWQKSSDKLYEVLMDSEGIHIKTNLPANSSKVVFHIQKIDSKNSDFLDDSLVDLSLNLKAQESIYPFVQRGQAYKIFLTYKTSKDNQSKSMNIISRGGLGEYSINASIDSESYDSNNFELKIKDYSVKKSGNPEKECVSGRINSTRDKQSVYIDEFKIERSSINLKPYLYIIRNSKFWLDLTYSFEYKGQSFSKAFFNNKNKPFVDTNKTLEIKNTGLPAVYIYTDSGKNIESRVNYVKGKIKINNKVTDIQIRGRGNSSWGQMPKHSFNIKLAEKKSLLGLSSSKKWVAISNYGDKTLLRNDYVSYLGTKVFNRLLWTGKYKQVDLFLNDKYQGTYLFGERINMEKSRLNLPEGSFLVEMDRREDEKFCFRTKHDVSISLKKPENITSARWREMKQIIQTAEDALFSKNFTDAEKGYAKYFDVDSFVDWYLINEFSKNVDSAWFSSIYIVYNSKDGKLHMGPLWDYDLGFGNISYNGCDSPEGFYIKTKGVWYAQLFKDPAFVEKVKKRWKEKRDVLLKSIEKKLPEMSKKVSESSYYNSDLWPVFGKMTWRDPEGYEKRLTMKSEMEYLTNWCIKRFEWMDAQFSKE